MTFEELKEKAQGLPMEPGVYLMQDSSGTIIYVGKAKKLRNRVSQYFVDSSSHSPKTRQMVSMISQLDFIVAASEFEALVLECSLIKRHMPKYNILLKDDKGYPYVRLDLREDYPVPSMSGRVLDDGAEYYGPFGGRYITQQLLDALRLTFRLPGCGSKFSGRIGKQRPCLNHHMNNCDGWCQPGRSKEEYRAVIRQVSLILQGKFKQLSEQLHKEMLDASEALEFERAALLRDRLHAIDHLGQKQLVTAGRMAQTDVIGYFENESKACFSVLHYVNGTLLEKECEVISASAYTDEEAISALVKQYYLSHNYAPKEILLPAEMEDRELFETLLSERYNKRIRIRIPQRGTGLQLIKLSEKNAREEAQRVTTKAEHLSGSVRLLQNLLQMEEPPKRMEAYDISNISGTDNVASMVVFYDGKPLKSHYKRFKVDGLHKQDDYGSMYQVLTRRFQRYLNQSPGFDTPPDLLLIDGGLAHVQTALHVLHELDLNFPVAGMVKDDRHRTRALVLPSGEEVGIQTQPAVFSLIGSIQEETHRFAISYHRSLRSKRLRESELDRIPGIGKVRKSALLKAFHSVAAISKASLEQLENVLPKEAARQVSMYFHPTTEEGSES